MLPNDLEYYPLGMMQKLAILSDHFAIGWAGNAKTAQREIQELDRINQIEPFTRDSLEAYFKGLELRVSARELQLLCVIKKSQDIIFSTFGGKIFTHPNYGYIGMLGSGMNYLQKYLDKQIHLLSADHGLNPAQFGILFALRTSGDLLSREFITQSTLEQFFGAGYEVIAPTSQKFQKIDHVTYLLWLVRPKTTECILMRAYKYWYVDDVLWIRTARLQPNSETRIRPEPYSVLPIHRPIHDRDYVVPPSSSFNSPWLCSYFFVAHPETDRLHVFPDPAHYDTGEPHITLHEHDGRLTFELDEDQVKAFIQDAYRHLLN